MLRLRIERHNWPLPGRYRPGLYLTDTPRPDCPHCLGDGGIEHPCSDEYGEYADFDWAPCTCWNEDRRWLILPLPHPKPSAGFNHEPPF
ncbi:hypothetical protein OG739_18160 [Streptomyces longwoodensis]|uniref:hypothetical protein n=1 Tax=Streptomyces longwoodensis TaxID=68231 RepID=UPI003250BC81